jgi:hypothetical protein
VSAEARPAFYALAPGGWRDYVTLLHLPYTTWHLSYVVIGACLAPHVSGWRLVLTVAAFFLGLGVGAHALDELNGRPLQTRIPTAVLIALAACSLVGASAIGIAVAIEHNLWLLPFVGFGAFIAVAYNLELFGGLFHNGFWLATAWGAFPVLTAYFAMADRITGEAVFTALFAALLIRAQQVLSTVVRDVRRRTVSVTGTIERKDGSRIPIGPETLTVAPETALRSMAAASTSLAVALLVLRFF